MVLGLSACFRHDGSDDDFVPDCTIDSDCPDTNDPCRLPSCFNEICTTKSNVGSPICECASDGDCNSFADTMCRTTSCDVANHACVVTIAPAGPAPEQTDGDCRRVNCDGSTATPVDVADDTDTPDPVTGDCKTTTCNAGHIDSTPDLADKPADPPCATATCTDLGPTFSPLPDGTACGASGFCFEKTCMTCTPSNPSSCGSEGTNEPTNDSSASPTSFAGSPQCGFLDTDDVDWFAFYAKDRDFQTDILRFAAWSSAPTIELCAYVSCTDGSKPGGGGCATYIDGPDGSAGCCWTGSSAGFYESWDLDCATSDDSGDVYVSVRSTSADACDTYAVDMSY